jgi:hypothetical protein
LQEPQGQVAALQQLLLLLAEALLNMLAIALVEQKFG